MEETIEKKAPASSRLKNLPFYLVSILLGLGISAFFLMNSHTGPRWALEGLPLDDAWIHLVYAQDLAQNGWPFLEEIHHIKPERNTILVPHPGPFEGLSLPSGPPKSTPKISIGGVMGGADLVVYRFIGEP